MDRALPTTVIEQQKKRRWRLVIGVVALMAISLWFFRNSLSNSLHSSEIRLATVETGAVENTLNASGEVKPEYEQVLVSPVTAVLEKVILSEGANVRAGDRILLLDKTGPQADCDKQKDQLALQRNSIVKLKLELDKSFYDLKVSDSIKLFRINALKADLENARRLYKAGGGARENIERLENDLQIALLEKKQLEYDLRTRQAIMQTSIRESELSASIQEKELAGLERKLLQTDFVANRSGVLTYVNKNVGSKVGEGELLARLADLGSFKVLGSISDNYAEQLRVGMPVVVKANGELLRGILHNIYPSVTNNVVTFDVAFQEQKNTLLRPNMKVEVYPVTDSRPAALRVANGPAFKGVSPQDVFVRRPDGILERRTIRTGLSNFDFVEILEGLSAGETVVISDLSRFKNAQTIQLK